MSLPVSTGNPPLHNWRAEGTGELSSRWLRPICSPSWDRSMRRHVDDFKGQGQAQPTGDNICPDCLAISEAMKGGR